MEHNNNLTRHYQVLVNLAQLPAKILQHHSLNNIPEFVLHDLCNETCFNLSKAAYFVDNPDFNCLRGVAGYCKDEDCFGRDSIWCKPEQFTQHMQRSLFNQKVRSTNKSSIMHNSSGKEKALDSLAQELGIKNPSYSLCDLKHDNHGVFVFEKADTACDLDDYLHKSVSLLGFCPINL